MSLDERLHLLDEVGLLKGNRIHIQTECDFLDVFSDISKCLFEHEPIKFTHTSGMFDDRQKFVWRKYDAIFPHKSCEKLDIDDLTTIFIDFLPIHLETSISKRFIYSIYFFRRKLSSAYRNLLLELMLRKNPKNLDESPEKSIEFREVLMFEMRKIDRILSRARKLEIELREVFIDMRDDIVQVAILRELSLDKIRKRVSKSEKILFVYFLVLLERSHWITAKQVKKIQILCTSG